MNLTHVRTHTKVNAVIHAKVCSGRNYNKCILKQMIALGIWSMRVFLAFN